MSVYMLSCDLAYEDMYTRGRYWRESGDLTVHGNDTDELNKSLKCFCRQTKTVVDMWTEKRTNRTVQLGETHVHEDRLIHQTEDGDDTNYIFTKNFD